MPYDALAIAAPPPHVRTMPEASPHRTADSHPGYRLQANMRRGTGSSLAGTWSPYLTIEAAREAALEMLRDDRGMSQ